MTSTINVPGIVSGLADEVGLPRRRVARVVARALGGCRIDDAVRGDVPFAPAMWILSQLVRDGHVAVTEAGWVGPPSAGSTLDGGLIDPLPANDIIDWPRFERILAERPYEPSPEFSQSFDTIASLRRRLAMMEHYNDLAGRSILQLGDDEMFSVALAMVDDVRHVHLIDADERILKAVQATAATGDLPLSTERVDILREPITATDVDCFYVSGLKDAGGLTLFIASAVATTNPAGAVGYVSFDYDVYQPGMTPRQVLEDLSRTVARLDCVVTALVPCEDLLLGDDLMAKLANVLRESAAAGDSPQRTADRLSPLAEAPDADLWVRKHGYPFLPLLPNPVIRLETGPQSVSTARRVRGFLQRAANGRQG